MIRSRLGPLHQTQCLLRKLLSPTINDDEDKNDNFVCAISDVEQLLCWMRYDLMLSIVQY